MKPVLQVIFIFIPSNNFSSALAMSKEHGFVYWPAAIDENFKWRQKNQILKLTAHWKVRVKAI